MKWVFPAVMLLLTIGRVWFAATITTEPLHTVSIVVAALHASVFGFMVGLRLR